MDKREERILERLRMQKMFIETAREANLVWSRNAQDDGIRSQHLEIADFLAFAAKQYIRLIEGYRGEASTG